MSSFVDLMASARWTEADIVNRMEALIRRDYPAVEEQILNRKMNGAAAGFYVLQAGEMAEIGAYAQTCLAAQLAGRAAREDMALLARVLEAEEGGAPLASDDVDGHALLAARAAARPALEPVPLQDEQAGEGAA